MIQVKTMFAIMAVFLSQYLYANSIYDAMYRTGSGKTEIQQTTNKGTPNILFIEGEAAPEKQLVTSNVLKESKPRRDDRMVDDILKKKEGRIYQGWVIPFNPNNPGAYNDWMVNVAKEGFQVVYSYASPSTATETNQKWVIQLILQK